MEYQSENKTCQNCQATFAIEPDDFGFYEKIEVPPPTFCPECRRQMRFGWRNFVNFHKNTCVLTGNSVVSVYSRDSGIPVCTPKAWHSDSWDAKEYAMDYDFSKTFFEQYVELLRKVPKPAMDTDDGLVSTNCMYTNDFAMGKDCYLVVKAWKLENVMYSFYVVNGRELVDVHTSFGKDEANYETINTEHCYRCRFVFDSRSCSNCSFCFDCRNCSDCFMCTGLRGKSYCYKNQEVGKEEYEKILAEYALHTYAGQERAKKEFEEYSMAHPRKALRMTNCTNSLGDLLTNCNDCKYCYLMLKSEHCKFDNYADGAKDSYDTDAGGGSELVYQSDLPAFSSNIVGCYSAWHCQDSAYISQSYRSKNCFGCNGLKDASFCILNKQYTKDEYVVMLEKIRQHMIDMPYIDAKGNRYSYGDYLPLELSLFPYEETEAQVLYPLSPDEIAEAGYARASQPADEEIGYTIQAQELPDSIDDVDASILGEVILSLGGKRYRLTEQELTFYKKYRIPLPRESFHERHVRRHARAGSFRLYLRKSDKSGVEITSSYPPGGFEKVWSVEEYKQEFE
jgi:hypothetical protein